MSRLVIRSVLALGAVATLATPDVRPVAAQVTPAPSPRPCRRCLDDHRFLASSLVPDPFVATYFNSAAGGGLAMNLEIPVRNADGTQVETLTGDIGFLLLDFRYQYAVTRWLAVRASASAAGRVGTSTEAILASGASAAYGGSFGLSVRVWQSRHFYVSLTGDYSQNTDYVIDPFGFARGVAVGGLTDSTRALLLDDERLGHGGGGLRGAWAPTPWIGVNAGYELGAAESIDQGWNTVSDYGMVADVDFGKLSRVPIGVAIGGRGQTGSRGVIGAATAWTLGVHYTGRQNFTIGLEGAWARQQIESEVDDVPRVNANQMRLVTRLDF